MPPTSHERAPAKLTRTLRVVGTRPDGYHLLEAEMVALDLVDELEIDECGDGLEVVSALTWSGGVLPEPALQTAGASGVPGGEDNLVRRALRLVGRAAFVRLTKRIPPGAGLGGGSSDAAAVLRWSGCRDPSVAVALGADVPFCLVGGRALVGGIGEALEPLEPVELHLLLVTPPFPVSTPAVYAAFDEIGPGTGPSCNDLENAACTVEPRLSSWRGLIADATGRRPVLAGSGATWFIECGGPSEATELAAAVSGAVAGARTSAVISVAATEAAP